MPTESELRDRMQGPPPGGSGGGGSGGLGSGGLDAEAIVRSARRRRRPKQALVAGGAGLALVAILAVPVVGLMQRTTGSGSSAVQSQRDLRSPGGESGEKSAQQPQGATTASGCSADTTALGDGPRVSVADLAAQPDGTVTGTAILTGVDAQDAGTLTPRIAVILTRDGARAGEADIAETSTLTPDADGVARIPLSFTPTSCDGSALTAGTYTVTPVAELLVGGDAVTTRSVGEPVSLTLP